MKVRSIGSNKTEVELNNLEILVSYETPVAAISYGTGAVKTDQYFSNTTSKHVNQWLKDKGYNPSKVGTMDQKWFDQLLEDNTPGG